MKFNYYGFKAIYFHEMNRFYRTVGQSLLSPVISTSLYFVVFGSVIGGYIQKIDGVSYGSYIVPGLLMLTLLTQSISNTSFGIFFPKFNGTINEILAKISLIVPLNFGKNIPNEVLLIDWVSNVNINKPGTIYEP